jgi:hypothetical protein
MGTPFQGAVVGGSDRYRLRHYNAPIPIGCAQATNAAEDQRRRTVIRRPGYYWTSSTDGSDVEVRKWDADYEVWFEVGWGG